MMIVTAAGNIWKRTFGEVHGYTEFIDDWRCM